MELAAMRRANGDEKAYNAFMALSKGFVIDGPKELAEVTLHLLTHPKSSAKAIVAAVKNIPGALADIPNAPAHVEAYLKELGNLPPEEREKQTEALFRKLGSWGFRTIAGNQVVGGAAKALKTTRVVKGVGNMIPKGNLANHLFKGVNKLADTAANRALIIKISNGVPLGIDKYGKLWYAKTLKDGTQIYTYTRNGIVKGAGINKTPVNIIKRYGLK